MGSIPTPATMNVYGFMFVCKNWKLIVHLLLNTKRFGVNNQWKSSFDSTLLGEKRGIRYVIRHYKSAKYRAVSLGFLSPKTCHDLGWNDNWKYYKHLY